MPMVPGAGPSPNQQALNQGAAGLGVGLGAMIVQNRRAKKLHEERSGIEQQIREAPDFQSALTAIESSSYKLRGAYENELLETAKRRFPEQEIIQAISPDGTLKNITQEKGRPKSDDDIRAEGLEPARQFAIVSTDKDGNIEIHDSAIGTQAAEADRTRLQEMFPDRTFQVAQGPEIETFDQMWARQLEKGRLDAQKKDSDTNSKTRVPGVEEVRMWANVKQELDNDPLATENGAIVLDDNRNVIIERFKDFNGKFEGNIFSLESPDSAALVQNGIRVASAAVARGLSVEKATDLGFNNQILGRVVTSLSRGGATIGTDLSTEVERRFKVNAETLKLAADAVVSHASYADLPEYDHRDPSTIAVPTDNGTIIVFGKINDVLVPISSRSR